MVNPTTDTGFFPARRVTAFGAASVQPNTRGPAAATTNPCPDTRTEYTGARGPFSVAVTVAVAVSTINTSP